MTTHPPPPPAAPSAAFIVGDGEMADLVRHKDWSLTPLGSIDGWPQSLRTTVSLCLTSNFPINIIWGAEHCQIYNDGYKVVCGSAHPTALGQSYRETWASAWPAIGEPFERALDGATSFLENQRMFLTRNGYLEETFFTFSLSPIRDESGGIGGLFHPVTETSAIMLAERRTVALRDMTSSLATAADVAQLASLALETLARFEFDLPFVLFYELDIDKRRYKLIGRTGIHPDSAGCPPYLDAHAIEPWPIAHVKDGATRISVACGELLKDQPCGPYDEPPNEAFLLPIWLPGLDLPPAIVIAAASPRLPMDSRYRSLFELLGAAFSASFANVRARQEEHRRAEALAELDRAKTVFFSNVSHEFRTPLTLMLGPLEDSLAQSEELPAAAHERITVAYRNAQRLMKLVNTLLDFSRIEAGRHDACFEATPLAEFTAELASTFRSATERAGLQLIIDAAPLEKPVYVDRDMWEKVVFNLLSNAFKFTFDGEIRIAVAASGERDCAEVRVSDTGIGVPANHLSRLFERFHRVEAARGRSFEGSGIGLSLVQELINLHAGHISVTSTEGRGTTFIITLPFGIAHLPAERIASGVNASTTGTRSQAYVDEALGWLSDGAVASVAGPPGRHARRTGGSVLLADDNADMRNYVQRLLESDGFDVTPVRNGAAALEAAILSPPDLVLSDIMMPQLDGFGLLAAWRRDAALQNIPFVLLSARAGEEARLEGLEAGADDYLTKPFSARELLARVRTNLTLARDRREAALRASEARLRELNLDLERQVIERSQARGRIWQVSPELLGIAAADGRLENINPAWKAVLGWSEEAMRNACLYEFMHADERLLAQAIIERAVADDQPALRFENRFRNAHGGYRWLSWVAIVDAGSIYFSARDITDDKARAVELAKTQESLRQSQKIEAIGRLTGGVAHDFNNLLMVINGGLEIVERQGDPARRQRILAGMRQAAQRGAALTRQLLAFSRRQALRPKALDLARQIGGMRELLERSLRGDLHTNLLFPTDLWPVEVDPGELELVVLNLCVNARDAMPTGGAIEVGAENVVNRDREPLGECVRLYVKDSGSGMSAEIMAHVFEPFFTTKDIGKGSGLGLAQVYGFAKQSGGTVEIDSVVGRGTTVSLWLPRTHKIPESRPDIANNSDARSRAAGPFEANILLVEDDDEVAALVLEMLSDLGADVTRVASATAALGALANERRIDLVFSDIMMPGGMDGLALTREIKARRCDLPVVLMSGYADAAKLEARAEGVPLLAKPFESAALVAILEKVLPESFRRVVND